MQKSERERATERKLMRRRVMASLHRLALKEVNGIYPGDPRYLDLAHSFSPLRIPLGDEKENGSEIIWQPGSEGNGLCMVLGASGSGKTEALKTLGSGIVERGYPVLVLDFHGDVVFPGLNSVLISSGASSFVGVNPMEIDWQGNGDVGFADQVDTLVEMIMRAVPIKHRQKNVLIDAFTEAYLRAGFHPEFPETWRRRPPALASVLQVLTMWRSSPDRKPERERISGCMDAIRSDFRHEVFNRQQNLSMEALLSYNVRVDLSKLPASVRYIVAETLLWRVFRALRLRGPIPFGADDPQRFCLFIMIDEAKLLSMGRGDVNGSNQILNVLMTEGRKYGIGLIVASQMAEHFGNEARASAGTWLVMKPMDMAEAKKNALNVLVPPEAVFGLQGKGDAFLRVGSVPGVRRIQVKALSASAYRNEYSRT